MLLNLPQDLSRYSSDVPVSYYVLVVSIYTGKEVAPQNRRNSKAEGEFATVKFRSLPVVDGNRAGTPHEIQTLGHATIPPTSWALTNGYFYRRCRAEANPGIGLPALVRKLEKLRGKRWDRGERERETGDV